MKKLTNKALIIGLLMVIVAGMMFSSCKKKTPPDLPPKSAFVLSDMDSTAQKATPQSAWNFFYASADVAIWTTLLKVGLVVPTAAYTEAYKHQPKHVSGNKWLWEYDVNVLLATYNVKLYGTYTPEGSIEWEMVLSKNGGFQDFTWFTGTQNAEGTSGNWVLYKSPTENYQLLQIDWTRNSEDSTGSLKYTNIVPDGNENGGYIFYGNDQTGEYNAYYDIYNKGANNLTEIDYNTIYHNGRVKDPNTFKDSLWHCWDENFMDTDCGTAK